MLDSLSDLDRLVLDTIAGGSAPWTEAVSLLLLLSEESSPAIAADVLDSLTSGGWIVLWEDCTPWSVVTLTPWAAERLGLVILENETSESARWGRSEQAIGHYKLPAHERLPRQISASHPNVAWLIEQTAFSEWVEASREPEPEYLADRWTGAPIRLFSGPDGTGVGVAVKVDPRIAKKGRVG